MKVYEKCPQLESERFFLRLVEEKDGSDLLDVYGDKNALPFVTGIISTIRRKRRC